MQRVVRRDILLFLIREQFYTDFETIVIVLKEDFRAGAVQ